MASPSYFLVSVSNRRNLDLCMRHALAGFTNSITGVWTFCEVREGDFISFLYGARAHNLYGVVRREAIKDAQSLPPWPPVTFRESGRTYYFPFRLYLNHVREFNEPLVRSEFAYVAENLLLRAGYRKTHFQADQTTLQNASQMGSLWHDTRSGITPLDMPGYTTYAPLFTRQRSEKSVPLVFSFQEVILQAALRQRLSASSRLMNFLRMIGVDSLDPNALEVLSEKAVSQGHVDLLIKESVPIGMAKKVVVEVKLGRAEIADLVQLSEYMGEFGGECISGALIAEGFPKGAPP